MITDGRGGGGAGLSGLHSRRTRGGRHNFTSAELPCRLTFRHRHCTVSAVNDTLLATPGENSAAWGCGARSVAIWPSSPSLTLPPNRTRRHGSRDGGFGGHRGRGRGDATRCAGRDGWSGHATHCARRGRRGTVSRAEGDARVDAAALDRHGDRDDAVRPRHRQHGRRGEPVPGRSVRGNHGGRQSVAAAAARVPVDHAAQWHMVRPRVPPVLPLQRADGAERGLPELERLGARQAACAR
jgi:hypothetical protein